jgi:hypothetical protein
VSQSGFPPTAALSASPEITCGPDIADAIANKVAYAIAAESLLKPGRSFDFMPASPILNGCRMRNALRCENRL